MIGLKRYAAGVCIFITFISVSNVNSQPTRQMEAGEVVDISDTNITISFGNGVDRKIQRDLNPNFVKTREQDRMDLKVDDLIAAFGSFIDEERFRANIINMLPKGEGQRPTPDMSMRNRNVVIGKINHTSPLSIIDGEGNTITVEVVPMTRVTKEIPVDFSEINIGDRVRMLPHKIIILPIRADKLANRRNDKIGKEDVFMKGRGPQSAQGPQSYRSSRESFLSEGSTARELLPDLSQLPRGSDFIYGIWLGRGLFSNIELERAFRVAKNLGVKFFKVEFKWDYVESHDNQWRWNDENTLDVEQVIFWANQYNLSIIPYFNLFMPWGKTRKISKGDCDGPTLPRQQGQHQGPDPDEYAEYVFSVVDKLKTNGVDVKYIELDNEVSDMNDGYNSWNCFINITAKQLKVVENAAYDRVKSKYPDVMVSSTTFNATGLAVFGGSPAKKFNERLNSFLRVYFGEVPKPKFDFLALHEILPGSGNPYTTCEIDKGPDTVYNFSSYHDSYDKWRGILNRYGYRDTPIFTTESSVMIKGKQDSQLIQKVVFARSNAKKNNLIGWVLAQLSGSKRFTEGKLSAEYTIGITRLSDGYELREGYYAFYALMTTLGRYPYYEKKVMGELNSQQPWVEKFRDDKGNTLYAAFIPYNRPGQDTSRKLSLHVGSNKEVIITKSDTTRSIIPSVPNGQITLTVTQHPIFIEVKK